MYYDFDMFQEMNVSTGGSDLTAATGGVALNFILRSGSDTFRGSARVYFENESLQSNNMPADLAATNLQNLGLAVRECTGLVRFAEGLVLSGLTICVHGQFLLIVGMAAL